MTTEFTPTPAESRDLDDAALAERRAQMEAEAFAEGDDEPAPPEPDPEPQGDEEGKPEEEPKPEGDEEPKDDDKPQGKDHRVPVSEHMAARRRAQEAEAKAAKLAQENADLKRRLQYERVADEHGEDAAKAWLEDQRQRDAQVANAKAIADQQALTQRLADADVIGRKRWKDYDAQVEKAVASLGAAEVARRAAAAEDPSEWAYEFGKSILTPEERQAALEAEVEKRTQERVKEALRKQQQPKTGAKSVGHLPGTPAETKSTKSVRDMSDAEIKARDRQLRKDLGLDD